MNENQSRPRAAEIPDKPVGRTAHKCEGCPYPHHGFICWGKDGSCMRTDVEELTERHWRSKTGR